MVKSRQLVAAAVLSLGMNAALAQGWLITGNNSARSEYYNTDGDLTGSPYAFEGAQSFNEFNLNFANSFSGYREFKGQIYGVANNSDYRFPDTGLQAERINLLYENGEAGTPYRLEGGDVYSYLSYRTVQRSLKGAQLDIQPRFDESGRKHSLLFFSGANQNRWNDFDYAVDNSSGFSWLVEDGSLGSLSLNVVYNDAKGATPQALDRQQWITSIAADTNFNLGNHNLNLEGEVVYFDGDHEGDFSTQDGQGQSDQGYFAELVGNAYQRLDYRLRFEQYGQHFRPNAAVVVNDRRSGEAHVGWQFASGIKLRGRAQRYQDRFDSINQLDTDVLGIDLSGSLAFVGLEEASGRLRAYRQTSSDEFGDVDRNDDVLDFNLTTPLGEQINLIGDLSIRDQKNDLDTSLDATTTELGLSLSRGFQIGDAVGSVTAGIQYRDIDGGIREAREVTPRLALSLSGGAHTLRLSYDHLDQNRGFTAGPDVETATAAIHYDLRWKSHEFGLEANYFNRDIDVGIDTLASRVSLYWTWYFDQKSKATLAGAGGVRLSPASGLDSRLNVASPALLEQLAPGQWLDQLTAAMVDASAPLPAVNGQNLVYELPVLNRVDQRQRLAVSYRAQLVDRVALIVDLERDGSPRAAAELYDRILEDLIKQYGRPQRNFAVGEFGPRLAADLNSDRFQRVVEWDSYFGVIRYGIPRRMDGMVRIELQHIGQQLATSDTFWSMEEIR
ncbi:hypothetical protein [Congregibacter litoralis]|uniref:Uncharacterized protein n=1 Tax=Congregibacter litoralis KT71 TaxID=314285 RepID=A4ABP9_9GAMM|nr:hypothetical protein [Congregibacter litoralis]EAQ96562.1 hypothetical protein KT71_06042 [Congregibacter litoralis KT71]